MKTDEQRRATAAEMDRIRDLIADIQVAMLNTVDRNGTVRGRPMGTVLDADQASVWLFISAESGIAEEIKATPRVGLTFADPERDRYVSVSGRAELLRDRFQIRQHWRDEFSKWIPGGPDSPQLLLLQVRITELEFWDDSAKLMRDFFETIGAPYTGIPPDAVGEHLRLRPG